MTDAEARKVLRQIFEGWAAVGEADRHSVAEVLRRYFTTTNDIELTTSKTLSR
jgi:hypothetical protein